MTDDEYIELEAVAVGYPMRFLTFLTDKKSSKEPSSEFSRFFREASSREKKKVFMDVARKASEDQRKVLESVRVAQPAN